METQREKDGEGICGEIPDGDWLETKGNQTKMETWIRYCRSGLKSVRGGWEGHQKGRRKEWQAGQPDREKEDSKVILPVLFIPAFYSIFSFTRAGGKVGHACSLWLFHLVSKVTGFISLGTTGTVFEGEIRTKCTKLHRDVDVLLKRTWQEAQKKYKVRVFCSGKINMNHRSHSLSSNLVIYSSMSGTKPTMRHLQLKRLRAQKIWRL